MPKGRGAARTKLSRRRRAAPATVRPYSPELPFLLPPLPDATDPEPEPERELPAAGDRANDGPGSGVAPAGQSELDNPISAAVRNDTGEGTHRQEKRPLSPDSGEEATGRPCSPDSDGDDRILLSEPSPEPLKAAKGDVVFVKHSGFYHPMLVTRLEKKKVFVKFIYDLVKFKQGHPFKKEARVCRRLTYEEKVRCRDSAPTANPHIAETILLALEALEELEAREPVDDPEEFFKTQCDYIVRLRSAPSSPAKSAAGLAAAPAPSPPPRPLGEAVGDSEEDDDDHSDLESVSPPLPPRTPPPPLPPHLREEQRAYAGRLMEVLLSEACGRHLRAVHAGRAPSWRRDAFRRGDRHRLMLACSLGDLETCPELAVQARREALRRVGQLKGRRVATPRLYADEVMAPEAVLFAVKTLSDQPRSALDLDAELALGAARFRP